MERIVHIARSFKEADDWDVRQQIALTSQERIRIARILKHRAYPKDAKDVRDCVREK